MENGKMKENKNNNVSKQDTTSSFKAPKKVKRVGVVEGKLPDLDLDKFNSVGVEELFYGKNC